MTKKVEQDEPAWVRCPECGWEQTDMGRGVACEECGYGPMPSPSAEIVNVIPTQHVPNGETNG